ncbi:MAG: hypothetical protein JOZ24_04785 [Candidatus Eremiobacteraeota bacterium]|nr:hypothetical protein [Candidatus Eremiobacteraeota bacterium]
MLHRGRQAERGQVAPFVALALVPILGFAAFSVDVGYWRSQQGLLQTAADSAALAGAMEAAYPAGTASPAPYVTAAKADSASNGFTDNGGTVTVTVNKPPSTGNYTGDGNAVEVLVKATQPSFLAHALGMANDTVTARAVATLTGSGAGCIIALNPSAKPYTLQTTGGSINATSCGILDDGTFDFTGGTITATSLGVAGSVTHTGGTYGAATPAPIVPAGDPCRSIAGCAYLAGVTPPTSPCQSTTGPTLNPGLYCNGLKWSGGTATLNPGIYYIDCTGSCSSPPGFNVTGGTVNGSGVTFYVRKGAVNLTGGTINIAPPTSGNSAGVLFYQPSSNTTTAKLTGGSATGCPASSGAAFTGLFYAPSAILNITGGSSWDPSTVIVGSLQVTGGALTCVSKLAGGVGSAMRTVLVE